MLSLDVVEICAGAGGQALGLERAGFEHALAVELDAKACATLRHNRPAWKVAEGDVASTDVWSPADYKGVGLLAGGVPCPPFTIAGKQLGATDERDLFAWAIEQVEVIKPRALMLENVRGLSTNRFAAYRQHVLDRLSEFGYVAEWKLLNASDYGVPQLRPRFVLIALQPADAAFFHWPQRRKERLTVGDTLHELMSANGWTGADAWRAKANDIAPTIVGGSKKHGGADLGPTRAKRAWAALGVDAMGVANAAPSEDADPDLVPKLTCEMVARLQGWDNDDFAWSFQGLKTSVYRQIGNAFPPPVAKALGRAIVAALRHEGEAKTLVEATEVIHDPIYRVLRDTDRPMGLAQINTAAGLELAPPELERHISHLSNDFTIEVIERPTGPAYVLRDFKAFLGQDDHQRHEKFAKNHTMIS